MFPEDSWNEIEKYHSYSFEPYLLENIRTDLVQNSNFQQTHEKIEYSLKLKNEERQNEKTSEEPDLTIERHLYFDDFIKSLQVMSILHTAFLMSADILMV